MRTVEEVNLVVKTLASEIERLGIKVLCQGINCFNFPIIHVAPQYIREITQLVAFFNVKTIHSIEWVIQPKHDLMVIPMPYGKVNSDLLLESTEEFCKKLKELKTIPESE